MTKSKCGLNNAIKPSRGVTFDLFKRNHISGSSASDTDGSGGLSREEIVSALEIALNTTINPEEVDPMVAAMFNGIFDHFDSNDDDEVTMDGELKLLCRVRK